RSAIESLPPENWIIKGIVDRAVMSLTTRRASSNFSWKNLSFHPQSSWRSIHLFPLCFCIQPGCPGISAIQIAAMKMLTAPVKEDGLLAPLPLFSLNDPDGTDQYMAYYRCGHLLVLKIRTVEIVKANVKYHTILPPT
ncbi:MAG: hypothetical protein Q8N98_01120, partial [bacterium]|nr:hypothetical protein [bacterium]